MSWGEEEKEDKCLWFRIKFQKSKIRLKNAWHFLQNPSTNRYFSSIFYWIDDATIIQIRLEGRPQSLLLSALFPTTIIPPTIQVLLTLWWRWKSFSTSLWTIDRLSSGNPKFPFQMNTFSPANFYWNNSIWIHRQINRKSQFSPFSESVSRSFPLKLVKLLYLKS